MIRFLFVLLALLPISASAGLIGKAGPSTVSKGSNVWEVVYDSGNTVSTTRTWSAGADAGSLILADVVEATISNSKKAQMIVRNPITSAAVGRVAAKLLPIVGPASLAYDVWQELGCKFEAGQIKCDPGTPAIPGIVEVIVWIENGKEFDNPTSACKEKHPSVNLPAGYEITAGTSYGPTMSGCRSQYSEGGWGYVYGQVRQQNGSSCGQGKVRSFDGKCSTGNYVPKSEGEAADHYGENAPKVPGASDKAPGIVQEGQNNGVPVEAGSPEVSGPPSVQGSPSVNTSNKPDGSVVTTTTTPSYTITYQGNT